MVPSVNRGGRKKGRRKGVKSLPSEPSPEAGGKKEEKGLAKKKGEKGGKKGGCPSQRGEIGKRLRGKKGGQTKIALTPEKKQLQTPLVWGVKGGGGRVLYPNSREKGRGKRSPLPNER